VEKAEEDIKKLAEEKAKKKAYTESGRIVLVILTPLSILATIVALCLPGTQGPLLTMLLLVVLFVSLFLAYNMLYQKYYKIYLEDLNSQKRREINEENT